jgi:hypothetical protein
LSQLKAQIEIKLVSFDLIEIASPSVGVMRVRESHGQ